MPEFVNLRDARSSEKALEAVLPKIRPFQNRRLLETRSDPLLPYLAGATKSRESHDSIDEMFLAGQLPRHRLLGLHRYENSGRFEPTLVDVAQLIAEAKLVADVYFVTSVPCDWMGDPVLSSSRGFWDFRRELHRGATYVYCYDAGLDTKTWV